MKKQTCIFIILIMCLSLCACGGNSSDNSDTMESYVGNTYAGTSPWGEDVSITVKGYDADKKEIDLEYSENIDSERKISLTWSGIMVSDNSVAMACAGSREDDDYGVKYKYEFNIELSNQTIALTYLDGQKTELSTEGGSGFHQVGALSEEEKTVILERC